MKWRLSALLLILLSVSALPTVHASTLTCPAMETAVQVGTCPTDEELKYTFTGYCSDDARAYKGETDVCTDFQRYRALKNVALWEAADGVFDAYVSCDRPKEAIKTSRLLGIKAGKQGKLTQLVCSYSGGVNFTYRTRAECTVDSGADCATNSASCKASCN